MSTTVAVVQKSSWSVRTRLGKYMSIPRMPTSLGRGRSAWASKTEAAAEEDAFWMAIGTCVGEERERRWAGGACFCGGEGL